MTTLQTWSVGNTAACAKQRHACTSAGNPVTASMGCRAFEKNASGRPGASEGKARTCAHATQGQREPALAEMNRSTELSRFRVLPLSPPVCVLHLRGTRCRDEFHSSGGRTRHNPATINECTMPQSDYNKCMPTNSQHVERSRRFSSVAADRQNRKNSADDSTLSGGQAA